MQKYEENEERMEDDSIDLFAIAQDMWKNFRYYKKRFLFLILAVTVVFSSVRILNYRPNYKSYITFVITQKEKQGSNTNSFTKSTWDVGITNLMNNTFPYIMERGGLDNQIRQEMGLKEEDYLPVSLSAEVTEDLNLLTINAYSEDGKMAQTAVDVLEDYYPSYAYEIYSDCEMAVIDKSSISGEPVGSRNVIKNIILGFIVGCFIALIILGIMSIKAPTIRNNNDLKKYFNLSCLGLIPLVHFKKRKKKFNNTVSLVNDNVPAEFEEAMNTLRIRIEKKMQDNNYKTLLVSSSVPGEGKTTMAVNLALTLRTRGKKVLLIDADLRNPSVNILLGINKVSRGIHDILNGKVSPQDAVLYHSELKMSLILGNGSTSNTSKLLTSRRFRAMLEELNEYFDYIIIDTPPAAMLTDASMISANVDAALYVIRQDYAKADDISEGITLLTESGTEILGCVLNFAEAGFGNYGYGYGYGYYGYGSGN